MKNYLLILSLFFGLSENIKAQCATSSMPTNDCATFGDVISYFELNGIAAIGNSGCGSTGYTAFTTPVWNLQAGGTYTFSALLGNGIDPEGFAIWMDVNNDGMYSASEMLYVSTSLALNPYGSITIPINAAIGSNFHMRLMVAYNYNFVGTDACTSGLGDGGPGGENEDYLFSINCPGLLVTPSSTLVCAGGTATISAAGAQSYTFSSGLSNGVSFTPSQSASYTVSANINVSGTNAACPAPVNSVVTTISVTSVPLAISATSPQTLICVGDASTLTAAGAASYTWLPGNAQSASLIVNPSASSTYTLLGANPIGCPGNTVVTISVNPAPTMSIAASSSSICIGSSANLTIVGNAVSYTWSPGGVTNTGISPSPTVNTLYTATGLSAQNCHGSVSRVILVNPNPTVTAAALNSVVCSGGATTLTAFGANSYVWMGSTGNQSTVVNTTNDAIYTVTGSYTTGCSSTGTVAVNVFVPAVGISSNTTICIGAHVVLAGSGADTYTWTNDNSTGQAITVTPSLTTTYGLVASVSQDGVVCPASNSVTVTVNNNPSITATGNHTVICLGESAVLTGNGAGASGTYSWTGGSGVVVSATTMVSPIADQQYTVSGTDANGCKGSSVILLKVSGCVGIYSNGANVASLLVYPNPSNGDFTISADQTIILQITNELGQQVRVIDLNAATHEVKVTSLSNGIYFITGRNENGSVKQKIIVAN